MPGGQVRVWTAGLAAALGRRTLVVREQRGCSFRLLGCFGPWRWPPVKPLTGADAPAVSPRRC